MRSVLMRPVPVPEDIVHLRSSSKNYGIVILCETYISLVLYGSTINSKQILNPENARILRNYVN